MDAATNLAETLAKGFGITEIKNLYDFQLEQFGIYKDPNETVLETLQRVFSTDFMSHNDNAFLDLTIDRSLEINDGIGIEPNVYLLLLRRQPDRAGPGLRQLHPVGQDVDAVLPRRDQHGQIL
ncbi:MAG: hypothetical protein ACLSHG_12980 [Oscillospiraceae bacterium]